MSLSFRQFFWKNHVNFHAFSLLSILAKTHTILQDSVGFNHFLHVFL